MDKCIKAGRYFLLCHIYILQKMKCDCTAALSKTNGKVFWNKHINQLNTNEENVNSIGSKFLNLQTECDDAKRMLIP